MPKACSHWSLIGGQGSSVGVPPKYDWKAARGLIQWWEQIRDSVDSGLSRSRRYPHLPGWLCQLLRAVLVGWDPQRVLFSHTEVEGAWEIPLNSPPPLFLISWGHLVWHIFGQTEFHSLRTLNLRRRGWAQKKQRTGECLLQHWQFTLSGTGVLSDACFLLLQACPLVLYILLCSSHRLSFLFLSMPCDLRDLTSLTRDWTPGPWQWEVPSPDPYTAREFLRLSFFK